ncbi:protein ENHANCED DISEASE RESISTANCE 2 [Sesamum angolense]|uniref:Protein ENHANCED DISEASE RESISTANCE 2 n=1 Tax=Sesamum angolense TaxID=2727404 RepID=A0AAE1WXF3_9LAMI|nr:protein ENHANCED DISEASE RESISTANCE 2 [Sesamum angolense]
MSNSKVVYEGWMVRYGRRKIGRSFIHMRYFVLESRLLAYYKKKPQDNVVHMLMNSVEMDTVNAVQMQKEVPIKTLLIDGNCRVEDRGLKTHHGHMVYVLSVYNKKEKYHRMTMAAFNIQEALIWKEKIELVIDQHQGSQAIDGNKYCSFEYKSGIGNGKNASSSDRESQFSAAEDEGNSRRSLVRRTTIGNGPPESVYDWTKELDTDFGNQNSENQAFSRKYWRLLQCQNGLRIFEELLEVDFLSSNESCWVVEATCEEIFELVMNMDGTRCEWDCSFQYGSLVEEVDGHTAILYHKLQLDWFPMLVWPRDLCYIRYWRRNDDGSYVVLFRSRDHANCSPQPGFVRAHIESGGFNISPLKPRNGRPRTQVQHLMQIDLKGWGVGYISSFQQHCLLKMLNCVAAIIMYWVVGLQWLGPRWWIFHGQFKPVYTITGLREYFAQTDERTAAPRIPVMVNMTSISTSSKRSQKLQSSSAHHRTPSLDQIHAANRNAVLLDEYSDEDEDFQGADQEVSPSANEVEDKKIASEEEPQDEIDVSIFSGNLRHGDHDNARNCWIISDGNNFRVRSKNFCLDKSKIPGGKHLMNLVAVDWFKDTKRMDHVARRSGCAAQVASDRGYFSIVFNLQVPGSTHYSMVFYFVSKRLVPGSLLQRFVDGDDEFRNSRLKLIPSVPKGSWIVRQSVGSTPCLLGKAVDCNYIRGLNYLEIDVDIGSSTVANGVLGLVIGVITTLVVEMAFLVQATATEELPERLIGSVQISHIELSSAIVPVMETDSSS